MEWLDKLIPTGVTLVVVTLALIAIRYSLNANGSPATRKPSKTSSRTTPRTDYQRPKTKRSIAIKERIAAMRKICLRRSFGAPVATSSS